MTAQTYLFEPNREPLHPAARHSDPPTSREAVKRPRNRKGDCEKILRLLRDCGAEGVSSLCVREMCPCGATQRVSDLRVDGYDIECRAVKGSACGLYVLKNPQHRGKKYL